MNILIQDASPGSVLRPCLIRSIYGNLIGEESKTEEKMSNGKIFKKNIEKYCLGIKKKFWRPRMISSIHYSFPNNNEIIWWENPTNHEYLLWLDKDDMCELIYVPENKLQFCVDCKEKAPHIKCNLPDNQFICVSCKIIREL